jgi:TetR/AcrR family transcriptional repressor of nem operon
MKVSRQQMAANRERLLDIASRLFRERGFDAVSIAEVMQQAGMTHGAFYGHFPSKEALAAEAAAHALSQTVLRWSDTLGAEGASGFERIVQAYLSIRHRDQPGAGCAIAALGAELPRQSDAVRAAFAHEVERLIELLAGILPPPGRERALALMAQLVGAIVLARTLGESELSAAILDAARKAAGAAAAAA